ncbi:8110_t:CDS:2 [Ambispora leptoticha]|uniref:8110_t:CDS:1 n=1 Tax=Ambispora leptoticha TaxID=144679 RepID=A0A9N9DJW2_9GLOM|nr:8110_t:CDS:2 [Ambispora leptoticha]
MTPHAYAFGDVDNDEDNEFIVGNLKGELAIFKDHLHCVGDIRNSGKNSIVCVNAEGKCHIFDIAFGSPNTTSTSLIDDGSTPPPIRPIINDKSHEIGKPDLTLSVPDYMVHSKPIILLLNVDGDGQNEIILARTDRVLHIYNFQMPSPSLLNDSSSISSGSNYATETIGGVPSKKEESLYLTKKKKWLFDHQLTSLLSTIDPNTRASLLLVGQPGGHFSVRERNEKRTSPAPNEIGLLEEETNVEINIERRDDVFITCAWNGSTYVIDHEFNVVNLEFESRVCAFAAGKYAITPGYSVPCFMYVDFEDNIYVYYNIQIDTKPVINFGEVMHDGHINKYEELLKSYDKDCEQGNPLVLFVFLHQQNLNDCYSYQKSKRSRRINRHLINRYQSLHPFLTNACTTWMTIEIEGENDESN